MKEFLASLMDIHWEDTEYIPNKNHQRGFLIARFWGNKQGKINIAREIISGWSSRGNRRAR